MKKVIYILCAILIISSIAGYLYFENKFTPPRNKLKVSQQQDTLNIKWIANKDTEYAALLLPVMLGGIKDTFYLQFDIGSTTTLFYNDALQSIIDKYPFLNSTKRNPKDNFLFKLGSISVSVSDLKRLNYGNKIEWNTSAMKIIGTLGSDILEHKVLLFDFKKDQICFINNFPNSVPNDLIQDFDFRKRKVMLNGKVNNENTQFYFDSGSSAFELITDKNHWESLARNGAVEKVYEANSWGNPVQIHNIASDAVIQFGRQEIPIETVTYIEGVSFIQQALMTFSGMGGMIGNKVFRDRILIIDAKNEKFSVL